MIDNYCRTLQVRPPRPEPGGIADVSLFPLTCKYIRRDDTTPINVDPRCLIQTLARTIRTLANEMNLERKKVGMISYRNPSQSETVAQDLDYRSRREDNNEDCRSLRHRTVVGYGCRNGFSFSHTHRCRADTGAGRICPCTGAGTDFSVGFRISRAVQQQLAMQPGFRPLRKHVGEAVRAT
ncbi:hypothetical protein [Rhodococcus sp. MTM3W5.2]|uniref:hypothetical protein n=1 Tax=Rhodococcus sp. MTM3W5.2 TaxID=1805827 RepID=UPI0011AE1A54|nr:hypothetical protein [Rhodococcus sp. MTM3W5.2]